MLKRPGLSVSEHNGPMLGLAAIFGVSLIVGLLLGGIWARFDQKGIGEDDYIVMVSLIYGRDGDLRGAEERLALMERGDVSKRVAALANDYPRSHPDAQTRIRALGQLAGAMNKGLASATSSPSGTGGKSGDSSSPWTWLGLALVVICVLGIGGPLGMRLVRAARLSPSLGRTAARGARPSSPRRDPGVGDRWRSTPARGAPPAPHRDEQPDLPVQTVQTRPASPTRPAALPSSTDPLPEFVRIATTPRTASRAPSSRGNGSTVMFTSRYRHGIEPFDDVHPILSPMSGELIGACGLNSALKFEDSSEGRYYAVSIWAQDYLSGEPLKCIGLISSYCQAHPPAELIRWAKSGVPDEIVVANPGLRLSLETSNLRVELNVLALRYGIDVRGPDDSYFSELEVSLSVHVLSGAFPERSRV